MSELESLLNLNGSCCVFGEMRAAERAEVARLGQTEGVHLDFEKRGDVGGKEFGETQIDEQLSDKRGKGRLRGSRRGFRRF